MTAVFARIALRLVMAVIISAQGHLAFAQTAKQPAAAPSPVDTEPQFTSSGFGDWVLRCRRLGEGPKAQRACEVAQTIQVQGQQAPVAQVTFARARRGDPLGVTILLPVNITFASPPRIFPEGKATESVELGWRRCTSGGCVADAVIKDDGLKRWREATGVGQIEAKDAAGRDISVGMSFRGLAPALDALNKEP
jgi:invasion protein IalB